MKQKKSQNLLKKSDVPFMDEHKKKAQTQNLQKKILDSL